MDIKEIVGKIEEKEEFKEWQKSNPGSFFANFVILVNENNETTWNTSYYMPKEDKVCSITIIDDKISISQPEEILKKPGQKVKKIDLSALHVGPMRALEIGNELMESKYNGHSPLKIIVILINTDDFGQIWNISYATNTLNLLNLKIDSNSGEIKEEKFDSLANMMQMK